MGKTKEEVIDDMGHFFVDDSRIPEPYFEFDRQIRAVAGHHILANIPYGSMSILYPSVESWLDVFVITSDRRKFHEACEPLYCRDFAFLGRMPAYHSSLEWLCAPNYYHYSLSEKLHFKYCPIEIGSLEKAVDERDFSLTGRFMKVMRIMDGVDEDVKQRLLEVYFRSMSDGVELAIDVVTEENSEFSMRQLTYAMLGLSYFTDRRLDKDLTKKVDDLFCAESKDENSYDVIVPALLEMERFSFVKPLGNGAYFDTRNGGKKTVKDIRRELRKYFKALFRLYKGILTNIGSKDYGIMKAKKSGNYKSWMDHVPRLSLIPLGFCYHSWSELRNLFGKGPLARRSDELDAFLDAVKDPIRFEKARADLNQKAKNDEVVQAFESIGDSKGF